jgi:hypothetical protein
MDPSLKFIAAKLATLEVLVEKLLVEEFSRAPDPVAAAIAFGDSVQEAEARRRNPALPQDVALEMSESLIAIVDRVTHQLQHRFRDK